EHVGALEPKGKEGILGSPLDPRPHPAPALAAVGPQAGHVAERRIPVRGYQGLRRGQGQVVGQTGVHRLIEADRGNTKAKEAGVTLGELDAQVVEPEEVRAQDLTELRMHETRRRPTTGENRRDAG